MSSLFGYFFKPMIRVEKASHNFCCMYCYKKNPTTDKMVKEGEDCYKDTECCLRKACIEDCRIEKLKE